MDYLKMTGPALFTEPCCEIVEQPLSMLEVQQMNMGWFCVAEMRRGVLQNRSKSRDLFYWYGFISLHNIHYQTLYICQKRPRKPLGGSWIFCYPPSEADKKGVGHPVRPPSIHFSSKGKKELSSFLLLSIRPHVRKNT